MLVFSALTLIVLHGIAASWAHGRGQPVLLICSGAAVLLMAVLSLFLGAWYDVPSQLRLTLYMLSFTAPAILVATVLLLMLPPKPRATVAPLPVALVGGTLGLMLGYFLSIYMFMG